MIQLQAPDPAATPRIYDVTGGVKAINNPLFGRLITLHEPEDAREDIRKDLAPRFASIDGRIEKLEQSESKGIASLDARLTELVDKYLTQELKDNLIAKIREEIEVALERRLSMIETRLQDVERKPNG